MDKRRMFFRFEDGYVCNIAYIISARPIDENNAEFTIMLPNNNQTRTIKTSRYVYSCFIMDFT